jgi:hypothetical protein
MPTKTLTVTMSGDFTGNHEGAALNLKIYGTTNLGRVRAQKSGSGDFAFNIDSAASQALKYIPIESCIVDVDPASLENELADGDTIVDIPNWADGSSIVAASGNEPEWMSSGDFITSHPAIDFVNSGGDERLVLPSPAPSFASGEPFSIAVVIDNGNNNNKPCIGSDVGSGTYASMYGTGSNRNTMIQDESGNSYESTAGSTTQFKNKDIHVAVRYDTDRVYCYRRGVEIITGQYLSGTFSPSIIGNAQEGSSWNGNKANFARILISEEAWDDTAREKVEAWLAWEYGLQTTGNTYLPSGHYGRPTPLANPFVTKSAAFSSDIDISATAINTWSSYSVPTGTPAKPWTISGPIAIYPTKAYKAGTVTLEIDINT